MTAAACSVTAYDRLLDALHTHGRVTQRGDAATAQCPAHEDRNASLSVRRIEGSVLLHCHAGCHIDDILGALGWTRRDLFDNPKGATYAYDDGRIVHRTPDKKFRQSGNTSGTPQLFRCVKVRGAVDRGETVYLVEGEKDVLAIETLGAVATTAPMGAVNIGKADLSPLHGGHVIAVHDHDEAGEKWARIVHDTLDGHAASLKFACAAVGKDAADHIAAGKGLDELVHVAPPLAEVAVMPAPEADRALYAVAEDVEDEREPLYGDVAALLSGDVPEKPAPEILARSDGPCLFYQGKVNVVFGDPEGGKTWLALAAIAWSLRRQQRCLFVDLDHNGIEAIVLNLLALDAPREALADLDLFRYSEPEDGWTLLAVIEDVKSWNADLAVVDSVGELLPMLGKASNSPDEWTSANRMALLPLTKTGTAVVAIDHMAKNSDSRKMGAGGTLAKKRSINGVSIRVTNKEPFRPGIGGASALTVNKDRLGGVRQHIKGSGAAGEDYWGLFTMTATTDGKLAVQIHAPKDRPPQAEGEWDVTDDDLAAIDALGDEDRKSKRTVQAALGWGSNRATATLRAWRETQE